MEIKINIPKNDYKEPTDVRQDVVQCICDHIVDVIKQGIIKRLEVVVVNDLLTKVYIEKREGKVKRIFSTYNGHIETEDLIRIRGCEMQAVFDAMLDAGYIISCEWEQPTKHVYYFTDRFDKHDKHTRSFTDFID